MVGVIVVAAGVVAAAGGCIALCVELVLDLFPTLHDG
jgi:hypothetical protein